MKEGREGAAACGGDLAAFKLRSPTGMQLAVAISDTGRHFTLAARAAAARAGECPSRCQCRRPAAMRLKISAEPRSVAA